MSGEVRGFGVWGCAGGGVVVGGDGIAQSGWCGADREGQGEVLVEGEVMERMSWADGDQGWRVVALAGVFALGVALLHGWWWPVLSVDETRYLSVAWEMWLRGEWLVPRLNGAVYEDKPPFLFWMILVGWKVFGVGEWWPRVVSGLAGVAAVVLVARLARVLWPGQGMEGRAVWVLTTSLWWFLWLGMVMFDLWLAVAVLVGWNALVRPFWGWGRWVWYGLAVGIGLLVKGPVVLLFLLPPALLVRFWRGMGAGWRWYGGVTLGVAIGVGVGLSWLVPAVWRVGWGYGRAIGVEQTASRVVHSYAHARPVWWYVPLVPVVLLPWSVWPGLYGRRPGSGAGMVDPGQRFVGAAVVPAFVGLSLVSGKQVHYLLPLFPAWALWVARRGGWSETGRGRAWRLPWVVLGVVPLVVWWVVRWCGGVEEVRLWVELMPWYGVVVPAVVGCWAGWVEDRCIGWGTGLGLSVVSGLMMVGWLWGAGVALREQVQLRALAERVRVLGERGVPVAWVGRYQGELNFLARLGWPLAVLRPEDVRGWVRVHSDGWLVVPVKRRGLEGLEACGEVYREVGRRLVLVSGHCWLKLGEGAGCEGAGDRMRVD